MGNIQAALETKNVIHLYQPTYLFFVGIAAKMKDVELGDVVVATVAKSYEDAKIVETSELPRSQVAHAAQRLLEMARYLARAGQWPSHIQPSPKSVPKAIVAPIVSGGKVIDSETFLTQLKQTHSDAAAVEMEGLGFLQAVNDSALPGVVIRGISDAGANKSATDKQGYQDVAARNAAAFAFAMLDELPMPTVPPVPSPEPKSIVALPFPQNPQFVGREAELEEVQRQRDS